MYASAWDILMDWSFLRPRARHPLLRSEIIYNNYIPVRFDFVSTDVLLSDLPTALLCGHGMCTTACVRNSSLTVTSIDYEHPHTLHLGHLHSREGA